MKGFSALILALLLSTAPLKAGAQEFDYFELPPEQLLSAEVISASRTLQPVSKISSAVYVITQQDIRRSGVQTIPEALRMAPGVHVARAGSHSWAISIRGFSAVLNNNLLVMIDGRTVYNPLFSGTYWEIQDLVLEDIDRIEVIRGPGGTLWGANAVNGVINIITKHARETQSNLITGVYGNEEEGTIAGRHGGSFGDDSYYRVYAKAFERDSFVRPGGDDAEDEWHGHRGGFRFDRGNTLTLQGDAYRVAASDVFQEFSLTAPFSTVQQEKIVSKGGNILGRYNHEFNSGALLSVQSFIDYTLRNENLLSDDRLIFDAEAQYNFQPVGRHEVIAGIGYRYMIDNLASSALTSFFPASRKDSNYSAFIRDRIMLVPDKWYFSLGAKMEHNHYTGVELQPSARLQWFPDEQQTVWAAISRAVRTPSRIERDLDITNIVSPPGALLALPTQLQLTHNRAFDTEKLISYEIGYKNQLTSRLALDVAAFYNEYHDLLSLEVTGIIPQAGPPASFLVPLVARNDESAETYGGEIFLEWNVSNNLNLTATYSYLEMFVHAPTALGIRQDTEEGLSPVHQASLRSSWTITENWALHSALYYTDQLPESDVNNYLRLDMNLEWQFSDNLRFNLIGQNLLDDAHREFSSPDDVDAAEVERSIFGKLTWEF